MQFACTKKHAGKFSKQQQIKELHASLLLEGVKADRGSHHCEL